MSGRGVALAWQGQGCGTKRAEGQRNANMGTEKGKEIRREETGIANKKHNLYKQSGQEKKLDEHRTYDKRGKDMHNTSAQDTKNTQSTDVTLKQDRIKSKQTHNIC